MLTRMLVACVYFLDFIMFEPTYLLMRIKVKALITPYLVFLFILIPLLKSIVITLLPLTANWRDKPFSNFTQQFKLDVCGSVLGSFD